MQQHAADRVEAGRVEAGRDDDQIGPEPHERRDDDALIAASTPRGPSPVGSGTLRFGARAGAPPSVDAARAGRVVAVLVQRDRQHRRVVAERLFGAVAVVHVPVDDRHPLDPVRLRARRRQARCSRRCRSHALRPTLGVVPGRPDERIRVVDLAAQHRLDRALRGAGGQQRDS